MRSSLALLLATGLVLGPASPAAAAADTASTASTGTIAVELFGEVLDPLLVLGATDATTGTLRSAAAGTGAASLLGVEAPFGTTSAVSEGPAVTDPADGERCFVPISVAPELSAGLLCAVASAEKDAADGPVADAASSLATTTVGVGALAGALAGPLATVVDDLRVQVRDEVLAAATSGVVDACPSLGLLELGDAKLVGGLLPTDLVEGLVPPAPLVAPLATDTLPAVLEAQSQVAPPPSPCLALISQVGVVQDALDQAVDVDELAAALADLGELTVSVEDAVSTSGPTSTGSGSTALLGLVDVQGPSLAPLVAALEGLLDTLRTQLEGALVEVDLLRSLGELVKVCGDTCPAEDLQAVLDDAAATTPDVTAQLDAVLASLETTLAPVLDGGADQLLSLRVGGSQATSAYDATTGDVTVLGSLGVVELGVAPALAFLFDVADGTPVGALVEEATSAPLALAEGTPLATTISLGAVGDAVAETDGDGLEGLSMLVGGAQVHALQGLLGGVVVTAGDVRAASFAGQEVLGAVERPDTPDPAPTTTGPSGELPNTGGGAVLAAIAAIGLAAFLRRRRD